MGVDPDISKAPSLSLFIMQDRGTRGSGLLSSLPQFPSPRHFLIPRTAVRAKEEKQIGQERDASFLSLIPNLALCLSFPVREVRWVVVPPWGGGCDGKDYRGPHGIYSRQLALASLLFQKAGLSSPFREVSPRRAGPGSRKRNGRHQPNGCRRTSSSPYPQAGLQGDHFMGGHLFTLTLAVRRETRLE